MKDNRIDQDVAERVLAALQEINPVDFSSHDFIHEYCRQNERDYVNWLVRYIETDEIFKNAHSQIALFLAKNIGELRPRYHEIGRRESKTVHGTTDTPMWFAWD